MTDLEPARYRLQVAGPAARALVGRPPDKVAAAVYEFITTTLLDNSLRVGKRLLLRPFEHRADAYRSRRPKADRGPLSCLRV